jgi:hypothetical protein
MGNKKSATWKQLLEACVEVGKDKVLSSLEAQHKVYKSWEANAWSDPATYSLARNLQITCLKQDETLIKLRQLTDNDIKNLLASKA